MKHSRAATWLLLTALLPVQPNGAHASLPVAYLVTGCVTAEKFTSGPYTYQVFNEDREEMGLALYEGKTISIRGWLTPGDRLFVTNVTVVDDRCRPELQERSFVRD